MFWHNGTSRFLKIDTSEHVIDNGTDEETAYVIDNTGNASCYLNYAVYSSSNYDMSQNFYYGYRGDVLRYSN